MNDRKKLRQLAEKAKTVPWRAQDLSVVEDLSEKEQPGLIARVPSSKEEALFIAACHPAVILELLDALDEADRVAMEKESVIARSQAHLGSLHKAISRAEAAEKERDENEGVLKVWRRRCEEAEAELSQLRQALQNMQSLTNLCGCGCTVMRDLRPMLSAALESMLRAAVKKSG